jgi:hypothetical protein
VQVSLDSLDEAVYGNIRRGGLQGEVIAFVRDLAKVGFRSIDICLTIQRRNVEELQSHGFFTRLRNLLAHLPPDVNFRFKFAHAARVDSVGMGQTTTRKPELFLVPEPELDKLRANLAATGLMERTNISQIVELLRHQRDRKDIAEGRPMRSMLDDLLGDASSSRPTCKVMEAMTFIDSNGEVYPCCYTFNDNVAGWKGRSDFCVGSWRKERERGSSSESRGQEGLDANPLYRIWTGDRYAELRSKALPVNDAICARCTRHMAQNVLLNKLDVAFAQYLSHGGHMRRLKDCLRGIEDPSDDRYDPVWL